MSVRRSRAGIALWIAFLAGAGVLATGLVALWLALQSSVRREVQQAADTAEAKAKAAQAVLRDPGLVGALPEGVRFTFDAEGVQIPKAIGWIGAPESEVELRSGVVDLLDEVAQLEFDEDAEAGRVLERALGGLDPASAEAFAVRVRQGWLRHREGRDDVAEASRRELSTRLDGANVRAQDWIGALLLGLEQARVAGRPWAVPPWGSQRLRRLPLEQALALIASLKLRSDAALHGLLDDLRDDVRRMAQRRRRLEVANGHHDGFARVAEGALIPGGEFVVLVLPSASAEGEQRRGAVVSWSELVEWLRLALGRTPGLAGWQPEDLVLVETLAGANAAPVLGDRIGIRLAVAGNELANEPLWLGGLLITLGLVCGAGLVVAFRALRREAAATAVRADFMVSITHELKTPLASIRLLSEMLERGTVTDPKRRQEYHRLLAGESLRLNGLIENVLDLGRIERGERGFDQREQELDPIVEEVLAMFGPVASRDGLGVSAALGAPAAVCAVDRGALTQVVWNLVDNARKYAAAGQRLDIESTVADGHWRLRVRDYGPGIAEPERSAVFGAFIRADAHRDGSVPGVGLGLYLSRSIAKSHGGDLRILDVAPNEPPGACLELVLPVGTPSNQQEST